MAYRAGMLSLIERVRRMANVDENQYTVDNVCYWSHEHIQDTLDHHTTYLVDEPLVWRPQNISGTTNYLTAQTGWTSFETADSGTTRWIIRDSTGIENGTVNYTADYMNARITWSADQGGTSYYVTGYSYDVYGAAIEVMEDKLAYVDLWYDFAADNQSFSRSQVAENIERLINRYRPNVGSNTPAHSGGVMSGVFVRTDLNV